MRLHQRAASAAASKGWLDVSAARLGGEAKPQAERMRIPFALAIKRAASIAAQRRCRREAGQGADIPIRLRIEIAGASGAQQRRHWRNGPLAGRFRRMAAGAAAATLHPCIAIAVAARAAALALIIGSCIGLGIPTSGTNAR